MTCKADEYASALTRAIQEIGELRAERDRLHALACEVVHAADLRKDGEVYGDPDDAIRALAEYLGGLEK